MPDSKLINFILVICLCLPVVSASTQAITYNHKNFDTSANEFKVVYDMLDRCLFYSENVLLSICRNNINGSIENISLLSTSLNNITMIMNDTIGKSKSYDYFEEYSKPFFSLGLNISNFVNNYYEYLSNIKNLNTLIEKYNQSYSDVSIEKMFSISMYTTNNYLILQKHSITNISLNINEISDMEIPHNHKMLTFDTENIREKLDYLNSLMEKNEQEFENVSITVIRLLFRQPLIIHQKIMEYTHLLLQRDDLSNDEYDNLSIILTEVDRFYNTIYNTSKKLNVSNAKINAVLEMYTNSFYRIHYFVLPLIEHIKGYMENTTYENWHENGENILNARYHIEILNLSFDRINKELIDMKEDGFNVTTNINEIELCREDISFHNEKISNKSKIFSDLVTGIYSDRHTYHKNNNVIVVMYLLDNHTWVAGKKTDLYIDGDYVETQNTDKYGKVVYTFIAEKTCNISIYSYYSHNNLSINIDVNETTLPFAGISTYIQIFLNGTGRYLLNDTVNAYGMLMDYKGTPVYNQEINILFLNSSTKYKKIISTKTNKMGYYKVSVECNEIGIGKYTIVSLFKSDDVYIGTNSTPIEITINIPTKIYIYTSVIDKKVFINGCVKEEINNMGIPNATVHVYFGRYGWYTENIVYTNKLGNYSIVILLNDSIYSGRYTIYAIYEPTDISYLYSSTSDKKYINLRYEISDIQVSENHIAPDTRLITSILVVSIFLLILVFGAFMNISRKKVIPSDKTIETKDISVKVIDKNKKNIPKMILVDGRDYNKQVIDWYGDIVHISDNLKKYHTHREIQQLLIDENYPKKDVDVITNIFEKAMYSMEKLTREEIYAFIKSAEKILTWGYEKYKE